MVDAPDWLETAVRIAHVTDCFLPRMGGIERQVDGLARRQAARGDDVEIITSVGDTFGADGPLVSGRPRIRRPEAGRDDRNRIRYSDSLRAARELELSDYDLVHIHGSTFSPLAFSVARRARTTDTPVVFTLHSMWAGSVVPAVRAAAAVTGWPQWPVTWTAVSRVAAQHLQRHVGHDVIVLPNGVDRDYWRRPRVSGTHRHVRIVTVMRLTGRKRPIPLLSMLRALRKQLPADLPLSVRIIGDGPCRSATNERIRRWGMQSWVSLDGQLSSEEIRAAFVRSDLYVAPARQEAFGIAALEAHSAGLPVVAFAGSGVADIVDDGRTGLLVDDDRAMIAALRRLAKEPSLLTGLAHGAAVAPAPFDWDAVLNRTDFVYARAHEDRRGLLTPS